MAIKSGRVGVREDQVDVYGRVIISDAMVEQIKEALLNTEVSINMSVLPTMNPGIIHIIPGLNKTPEQFEQERLSLTELRPIRTEETNDEQESG